MILHSDHNTMCIQLIEISLMCRVIPIQHAPLHCIVGNCRYFICWLEWEYRIKSHANLKSPFACASVRLSLTLSLSPPISSTAQAAYKEWGNFQLYHSLFFKNQSLGPGGNNEDTVSVSPATDGPPASPTVATLSEEPTEASTTSVAGAASVASSPVNPSRRRRRSSDSESEVACQLEPGRKPARKTTRKREDYNPSMIDAVLESHERQIQADQERARQNEEFQERMEAHRQENEDRRERERREEDDRRARERREEDDRREREKREYDEKKTREEREYQEKREEAREAKAAEVRMDEKTFNAQLLQSLLRK